MPSRIIIRKGRPNVPVVICDQCGLEIALAADGTVIWRSLDISEPHFAHNDCSEPFRKAQPYEHQSMELKQFKALLLQPRPRTPRAKQPADFRRRHQQAPLTGVVRVLPCLATLPFDRLRHGFVGSPSITTSRFIWSMSPSRWNFFMKKFTRDRVVPTISASRWRPHRTRRPPRRSSRERRDMRADGSAPCAGGSSRSRSRWRRCSQAMRMTGKRVVRRPGSRTYR